jgi:site-specific DNA-methyltransferase (adenine-specific)
MPLRVHEQIAVFYKKLPTYNPQYTTGRPLHSKGKTYMDKEHKNSNYGAFEMTDDNRAGSTQKHPKSILSFQKPHPSVSQHRTEKSIECLEWLIRTYTNEGDVVLDNAAGSGTTAIASINSKRKYIAIELDKNYYDLINNRIAKLKEDTKTLQD